MPDYRYYAIAPAGPKEYRFAFPPVCVYCGKPTEKTVRVGVDEMMGVARRIVSFNVPYCPEHAGLLRKIGWVRKAIFAAILLAIFVLLKLLVFPDGATLLLAIIALVLWSVLFPLVKLLIVRPLWRLVDEHHIYEDATGTLLFKARLELAQLVLGFGVPAIAAQFAAANQGNSLVTTLEQSIILTQFPAMVKQVRQKRGAKSEMRGR